MSLNDIEKTFMAEYGIDLALENEIREERKRGIMVMKSTSQAGNNYSKISDATPISELTAMANSGSFFAKQVLKNKMKIRETIIGRARSGFSTPEESLKTYEVDPVEYSISLRQGIRDRIAKLERDKSQMANETVVKTLENKIKELKNELEKLK